MPAEVEYILENGVPKEISYTERPEPNTLTNLNLLYVIPIALSKLKQKDDKFTFEEKSGRSLFAFQERTGSLSKATHENNLVLLLHIRGDSMAPIICSGDVVMIDRGRKDISEGCIYAIGNEWNVVYLKKLVVMPLMTR